jgi:glycosyltransferase involved in cell wall biosynthesis
MKEKKKRILLLVDKRNWAFDICAREYTKYLSNEFYFDIKYEAENPLLIPFFYDLIHIFWWGETYYRRFLWPRRKILKEVSSHRWEDDPRYGPCTPEEMVRRYLHDASTVLCTSERLYLKTKPFFPHTFLVNNGYAPEKFHFNRERRGEQLTMCWAGNINDPVKGIRDILIPAAGDEFAVDIALNMKHEDLCDFYNAHDVFLVGSKHEASPLPLMEAMACGCFPVCTNVGIVPELVIHKKNGYIVENRGIEDFKEAFRWCRDNLRLVREAGRENSRIVYEKRRWEICAESFRIVYRAALEKNQKAHRA